MTVEYEEGHTKIGIPYKKLYVRFKYSFDSFEIVRYPRNIWVLHGDNSLDQTQGYDLSDCWEEPMVVTDKIPVAKFDILSELKRIELNYKFTIDKEEIDEICEKYKRLLQTRL